MRDVTGQTDETNPSGAPALGRAVRYVVAGARHREKVQGEKTSSSAVSMEPRRPWLPSLVTNSPIAAL